MQLRPEDRYQVRSKDAAGDWHPQVPEGVKSLAILEANRACLAGATAAHVLDNYTGRVVYRTDPATLERRHAEEYR